jgi:hypothetical protein
MSMPRADDQSGIDLGPASWVEALGNLRLRGEQDALRKEMVAALRALPTEQPTRRQFAEVMRQCTPAGVFALSYAWGAGSTLRGRAQGWVTQCLASAPRSGEPLRDVLAFVTSPFHHRDGTGQPRSQEEPVTAWLAFERLWNPHRLAEGVAHGIGTAFGTKLLYWGARAAGLTPRGGSADVPLIYDLHVHTALTRLGASWHLTGETVKSPPWFDHPAMCVRFDCYQAYVALLGEMAIAAEDLRQDDGEPIRPDDIERWLFEHGKTLEKPAPWSGCGSGAGPSEEDQEILDAPDPDVALGDGPAPHSELLTTLLDTVGPVEIPSGNR